MDILRRLFVSPVVAALALTGCVGSDNSAAEQEEEAQIDSDLAFSSRTGWVPFTLPTGPNPAANIKGKVMVYTSPKKGTTWFSLNIGNLPADKTFGAHLHAASCDANAGGGHYQHVGTAATRENEVWLDVTTEKNGWGVARVTKNFLVDGTRAKSVVVHAQATDPATAKAGDKLACMNVDLVQVGQAGDAGAPRVDSGAGNRATDNSAR